MTGPLAGIRIIEIQGIGPGPFCGMHFADLGADVILIERAEAADPVTTKVRGIANRGKRSIVLDLKSEKDLQTAHDLIDTADGLIEGMRPGVMERLGLGPEDCLKRNPKLVYGRLTGWGQSGPLAQSAGHDLNYTSLTGAAWYSGAAEDGRPVPPPTLVGDIAGGAHYLMIGMLAAMLKSRTTGKGDVIDAAIVDGTSHMMNLIFDVVPGGLMSADKRGVGVLDGAHWYAVYECADGNFVSIGSLESRFYRQLLDILGVADDPDFASQYDVRLWPAQSEKLAKIFNQKTRDEWCRLLEGTDACFAPVLTPREATVHPHNVERGTFSEANGYIEARTAPRFATDAPLTPQEIPEKGAHTTEIMKELKRE
ncbi:CaiB/BaiF CoA transferase family protein [Emcibacter sp.]|uniref:CaiB/BaiF CoA transferase family protein n=1 Tax=Emcibacter sp. TaxID=1979954 RepID=UPI003A956881